MTKDKNEEVEENFKELLTEVSKIGELIGEVDPSDHNTNQHDSSIQTTQPPLTEDNLQDYVFNSATNLIDSSLFTLNKIKQGVSSVMDHKELTALAELIKATTSSIDILNKVAVENKKLKNAKDIKKMDIEAKKELGNTKIKNQTNILVASREEVLKQLVEKTIDPTKIIDIEN
jgi:hypothetical protein